MGYTGCVPQNLPYLRLCPFEVCWNSGLYPPLGFGRITNSPDHGAQVRFPKRAISSKPRHFFSGGEVRVEAWQSEFVLWTWRSQESLISLPNDKMGQNPVPAVNIPIPTKIGSLKWVVNSPIPTKMGSQNGFDHSQMTKWLVSF